MNYGGKIVEQNDSNFADIWDIITYNGCAPEHYQRPVYLGYRSCNYLIHDFAFQDRSFKSKRVVTREAFFNKASFIFKEFT